MEVSRRDLRVEGNIIGTRADGTTPLPNFPGVFIYEAPGNTVGGSVGTTTSGVCAGACNVISGNLNHGVQIIGDAATGNRVHRNSIFENGGLGIQLKNEGVTPNDGKDPDTGPNLLQNFHVITSATTTQIRGTLKSRPRKTFLIQLFSNPAPNFPTGFGEGKTFLSEKFVTTSRRGKASFTFTAPFSAGRVMPVTATDSLGNTSEFSQGRKVE